MSNVASIGLTGRGIRATLMTAALVAVVGGSVLGIMGMHGFTQHGPRPGHGNHQTVPATRTDS